MIEHSVLEYPAAEPREGATPGSEEWRRMITASKVPCILGVSPWKTPFTQWCELAGLITPEPVVGSHIDRGHALEAGVATWYEKDNQDVTMYDTSLYVSKRLDWAYATPDRGLVLPDGSLSALEVKTTETFDDWGAPGTAIIPAHYWAQTAWQAIVLGVDVVTVTALGAFLERRDYQIQFDSSALSLVEGAVTEFHDSLVAGRMPEVHDVERDVKALLEVTEVEVETADVTSIHDAYREAKMTARRAEADAQRLRKHMMMMGADAEALVAHDKTVARRNGKSFRFSAVK